MRYTYTERRRYDIKSSSKIKIVLMGVVILVGSILSSGVFATVYQPYGYEKQGNIIVQTAPTSCVTRCYDNGICYTFCS